MAKIKDLNISWKNPEMALQVTQKHEKSNCSHRHVELDVTSRMTYCADCGLQIDPFDFLLDLQYEEAYLVKHLKSLREEREYITKQIKKLKKDLL